MRLLTQHFDACYVINLKRRPDRLAQCYKEIIANGGFPVSWMRVHEGFDHPTNGHAGCTRSHRELLRHIIATGHKRTLVLEDDFAAVTMSELKARGFNPDSDVWKTHCSILNGAGTINDRFSALIPFVPDNYDVLYLGGGYGEPPISRVNNHVIRCGFMQTTSSYGITLEFAKKWTELVDAATGGNLEAHPGPIDNTFGGFAKDHNYYVFQPRLIYQRQSRSDLTNRDECYFNSMTDPGHERMV